MNGVGLGSLGATTLFGEWGQYNDQFSAGAGGQCFNPLSGANFDQNFGTNADAFCNVGGFKSTGFANGFNDVFVTGSEVDRWGLGVVQEIDAAAMHVFARWQHHDSPDLELTGFTQNFDPVTNELSVQQEQGAPELRGLGSVPGRRRHLLLSQHPERISIGSRPLRGGFFLWRVVCLSAARTPSLPGREAF